VRIEVAKSSGGTGRWRRDFTIGMYEFVVCGEVGSIEEIVRSGK